MSRAGLLAGAAGLVAVAASVVGWQTDAPDRATAVAPSPDGPVLFQAKGCATCHTGPDSMALFVDFPSLANAPAWAGERRPGMSANDYVAESIRVPSAFISPSFRGNGGPTSGMPDLGLTEAEIGALVQYLLAG